jgi:hypothetical protein
LSLISTLRKFGERPADKIKPAEIDAWLSKVTKTPATSNRYRALFSLIFREDLRNGKIASNPARLVRQRPENNGRIRFLTEAEEMSLRDAIRSRFPEHEAELTISLGTGCVSRSNTRSRGRTLTLSVGRSTQTARRTARRA